MTTYTIKTRSTHPFALVKVLYHPAVYEPVHSMHKVREREPYAAELVGYAASKSAAVMARARRLGAVVLPIVEGKVVVEA